MRPWIKDSTYSTSVAANVLTLYKLPCMCVIGFGGKQWQKEQARWGGGKKAREEVGERGRRGGGGRESEEKEEKVRRRKKRCGGGGREDQEEGKEGRAGIGVSQAGQRTSTLGMDDALGDALSVKVGQLVKEDVVLEEDRAPRPDCHGGCLAVHRLAMTCGEGVGYLYQERGGGDNKFKPAEDYTLLIPCKCTVNQE